MKNTASGTLLRQELPQKELPVKAGTRASLDVTMMRPFSDKATSTMLGLEFQFRNIEEKEENMLVVQSRATKSAMVDSINIQMHGDALGC